ncbi:MAG TPA: alpha/beta fold hydrolase [Candidatus Limnocylindrales bacterium]|nr:alpha/beta fold hydrolase [Candidatus Limnocylindrales bacterium]
MAASQTKTRRWPNYVLLFAAFWLPVLALFSLLFTLGSNASADTSAAMVSSDTVEVTQAQNFAFVPSGAAADPAKAETAFIIYPGGLVDPVAYALYASAIAQNGYLTFITPMPLDLAVLNTNAAQLVIEQNPQITNWVIGGHSLGGAMAATFVASNPDLIQGLVLLASYPNGDLSGWAGKAVSIYGTSDGVANSDDVLAGAALLPPDTQFVPIEGGNHAQFGSYGAQSGDNVATISAAQQLQQAVQATVNLLDQVNAGS